MKSVLHYFKMLNHYKTNRTVFNMITVSKIEHELGSNSWKMRDNIVLVDLARVYFVTRIVIYKKKNNNTHAYFVHKICQKIFFWFNNFVWKGYVKNSCDWELRISFIVAEDSTTSCVLRFWRNSYDIMQ